VFRDSKAGTELRNKWAVLVVPPQLHLVLGSPTADVNARHELARLGLVMASIYLAYAQHPHCCRGRAAR
jgi:hypothetical protein